MRNAIKRFICLELIAGVVAMSVSTLAWTANASPTKLTEINVNFAKQYRAKAGDDVFILVVSGWFDKASTISRIQLKGPGGIALDNVKGPADGGINPPWAYVNPDPRQFFVQTQKTKPYPTGKYTLSILLTDKTSFSRTFNVAVTDPQDRPVMLSPRSLETVSTSVPTFTFNSYAWLPSVSKNFSSNSTRSLKVLVEFASNNQALWEMDPVDPDETQAAIGDPSAESGSVSFLGSGEHVVTICHIESQNVGGVNVGLENRESLHFFVP